MKQEIPEAELYSYFHSAIDKTQLTEWWYTPIKNYLLSKKGKVWDGVAYSDIVGACDLEKSLTKEQMGIICIRFYNNPDVLLGFFNTRSLEEMELIEQLTWTKSLNIDDFENIFDEPIFTIEPTTTYNGRPAFTYKYNPKYKRWHPYIKLNYSWNKDFANPADLYKLLNPRLELPFAMRRLYGNALPKPEGYYLEASEPSQDNFIFTAETAIFNELPLVLTYYIQGNLRYSQKGIPMAASARKLERSLKLLPFPTVDDIPEGLRANIMMGLMGSQFKLPSTAKTPLEILSFLFKDNFELINAAPYILPHLKGFNSYYNSDLNEHATKNLIDVCKTLPLNTWVSMENLEAFVRTRFLDIQPFTLGGYYNKINVDPSYVYAERLDSSNFYNYVTKPHLAGYLFLLGAFGLVELSLNEEPMHVYSPYEHLDAVKLTNLGAYLFGIVPNYAAPISSTETKLIFDDSSTTIRIEGNLEIGEVMVKNYTSKIADNRYQFDTGKLLKDCKSTNDVHAKLVALIDSVGQKLPPFWSEYLNSLYKNCQSIQPIYTANIYKLDSKNKELHRQIALDSQLRRLIIKAEGFQVIVDDKNKTAFLNRMKELGYFIEDHSSAFRYR